MSDDFDSPSEYVNMSELVGELLLFTPTEYIEKDEDTQQGVNTVHGLKDAIITDLVVVSKGESYDQVMILQGPLIGALKRKLPVAPQFTGTDPNGNRIMSEAKPGRKLLGVLGRGEAKRGQNAPFKLEAPTDEQKQMTRDYLAGKAVAAAEPEAPSAEEDPWSVKK